MRSLTYSIDCYTDPGSRTVNEDAVAIARTPKLLALLVADGLGGIGGGEVASAAAARALREGAAQMENVTVETVADLCGQMNQAVLGQQTDAQRMKSTFATVCWDNKALVFAHAGDSRIYQFRKGGILYQSRDHSVSQMAVAAGEIKPGQIRFHIDRNKVLRTLGTPEETFRPEIHVSETPLLPGDALLLCSDGFWEYVTEREMLFLLGRCTDAERWLGRMRKRMLRKNIHNQDNHSAVALICQRSV